MKAHELLSDESKWTQGADARCSGRPTDIHSPNAECWCISGAIMKCYSGHHRIECINKIMPHIQITTANITLWNDAYGRTFAEVKALLEKLDI